MNDHPAAAAPLTHLAVQAAQLHELYLSFIGAGFTDAHAMQMICTVLSTSITVQAQLQNPFGGSS